MSIISGLLQQKHEGLMVDAQLSLAPPNSIKSSVGSSIYIKRSLGSIRDQMFKSSSAEDHSSCKKRKMDISDWDHDNQKPNCVNSSIGVELQMKSPLPLEWEQCLDLQSGRIYYVNKRTQLKTSQDPRVGATNLSQLSKELRLDLELNLPIKVQDNEVKSFEDISSTKFLEKENMNDRAEMVATVCAQCHMFVMFSKSSRQCPNCKYVHPLMDPDKNDTNNISPARQTLSLIDCTGLQTKNKSKQEDDDE